MHLGEAAAEVEPGGALGQRLVGERVERDDVAAGRVEQLVGLGVAEGEGAAAGHGDDRVGARVGGVEVGGRPRLGVEVRAACAREPDDLRRGRRLGDPVGQPVEGGGGVVALGGRHEPEVARRRDDAVVAVQHAEHRQAGRLERADDLVGVPLRAGLVEDDADDAHRSGRT